MASPITNAQKKQITSLAGAESSSSTRVFTIMPVTARASSTTPLDSSRVSLGLKQSVLIGYRNLTSLEQTFPFLLPKEREMLIEMFNQWPLSTTLCPIDLFIIDLMEQFAKLKICNNEKLFFQTSLESIENNFFPRLLSSCLYFLGEGCMKSCIDMTDLTEGEYRNQLGEAKFFVNPGVMWGVLGATIDTLQRFSAIATSQIKPVQVKRTAENFQQNKLNEAAKSFNKTVTQLTTRLGLLQKFYTQEDPKAFLTAINLDLITEAQVMNNEESQRRLDITKAYTKHLLTFLQIAIKAKCVGLRDANVFSNLAQKFSQNDNSAELVAGFYESFFYESHKKLSTQDAHMTTLYHDIIRNNTTHEQFLEQQKLTQQTENMPTQQFRAQQLFNLLTSKWYLLLLNDAENVLGQILSHSLKGIYVSWKTCAQRAYINLSTCENAGEPLSVTDEFQMISGLQSISAKVATYKKDHLTNWSDLKALLNNYIGNSFPLKSYQTQLPRFMGVMRGLSFIERDLIALCSSMIDNVRTQHQKCPIQNPEELRELLSHDLIKYAEPLLRLLMVCIDLELVLTNKPNKPTVDALLLSPTLLDAIGLHIPGWDQIFTVSTEEVKGDVPAAATPKPEATSSKTTSVAAVALPSTSKKKNRLKKPSESAPKAPEPLPDKKTFLEQRRRRTIEQILKRCGFTSNGFKGSHEKFTHEESGKSVILPRNLEDQGTRASVYQQVSEAYPEKKE